MTLGEKLRSARKSRGLTQKQVAGDRITRNMLSQIENDLAAPSMKTLHYLAETLGVSEGWLMTDAASGSELSAAREARRSGYSEQAYQIAEGQPGTSDEKSLLLCTAALQMAEKSLAEGDLEACANWAELAVEHNRQTLYHSYEQECTAFWLIARSRLYGGQRPDDAMEQYKKAFYEIGAESKYHLLRTRYHLENHQTLEAEREIWLVTSLPERDRAAYVILRAWIAVQRMKYKDAVSYLRQAEGLDIPTIGQKRKLYELLELSCRELDDAKGAAAASAKLRELNA